MDTPFSYTKDQTNVLYQALKNAGLKRDAEWPRYLDAITHYVRAARHKADNEAKSPLPYASKAARRLDRLIKALATTLQEYEGLGSVLQLTVDHCLSTAILLDPLLMHSLLNSERPVAERLLSSGRFPLALKVVLQAAKLAAEPVRYGCPAHRVQGCHNGALVARTLVEDKILSGIRHDLFSPEGIEGFVKETTRLLRERQRQQRPDSTAAQKQLVKVESEIVNLMTAIKAGILTPSTKTALEQAEAERARLLAAPPPPAKALDTLTAFLPNATTRYRTLVDGLAALPLRHVEQAREQIKALVGDITLWPTPAGHLEAELTGNYAGFLKLAVGQYGQPYGPQNNGLYPPQ